MRRSGGVLSLAIMAALLAGPSAATAQWGDLHVTPKVERWYTSKSAECRVMSAE